MHTTPVIPLHGGCNFRDLGGYETYDGRIVRQGQVYRSGVMTYLTPSDLELLSQMGIRCICDLRRSDERAHEPTRWSNLHGPDFLHWDDREDQNIVRGLSEKRSAADAHEAMLMLYRTMHDYLRPRLRGVFNRLLAGNLPLVFHCSAGKDRTGLAAALVLSALGVPRHTIIHDYTFTNEAVDLEEFIRSRPGALGLGNVKRSIFDVPDHIRKTLLKANADYLIAALAAIEQRYGSVDAYLESELGVTAAARHQLRDRLLGERTLDPMALH